MKTRAGRTHEVTKDVAPSKDCKSCRETCVTESRDVQRDCSSERRSGVTETVISVVSTRTPRKTIEVAGGNPYQEMYSVRGSVKSLPRPEKRLLI